MIISKIKSLILKLASLVLNDNSSKIIYYHDAFDEKQYTDMGTALTMFKKHIHIIKEFGFEIVKQITSPKNEIMICFDDGFRGIWDSRKFFVDNDIYPTVFIAVELIGKENYLNKEEILELQSLGFIFQSHSWSHYNLTRYSDLELNHEIYDSKIYLTNLLGKEVDGICFPQGYFSDRVNKACVDAGYKKLYTSISGNYFDRIDENIIPRNLVQYSSPFEFKSILFGGLRCLKRRYIKLHYMVE